MKGLPIFDVVFDNSTKPATVHLRSDSHKATARFSNNADARAFFDAMVELRSELYSAYNRLRRLRAAVDVLNRELDR